MTAYRAGVRDRSGPMKSVKIPDRSGELEPAMSDFFSRSHSSFVIDLMHPNLKSYLETLRNNREIAARLVISEKTVKTHVSSILGKLHLEDRTQAAVYAFRHGLASGET